MRMGQSKQPALERIFRCVRNIEVSLLKVRKQLDPNKRFSGEKIVAFYLLKPKTANLRGRSLSMILMILTMSTALLLCVCSSVFRPSLQAAAQPESEFFNRRQNQ